MAEATIPLDLFNPGQVFACLGFLEAAETLLGNARGAFDWSDASNVRFKLRADGEDSPVQVVLDFLRKAEVSAISPSRAQLAAEGWGVTTTELAPEEEPFPFPCPSSPATLPARLSCHGKEITIDYWGDEAARTGRDNAKFWAGAGGYPGAALAKDALELMSQCSGDLASDPFNVPARQSSSFRFDWRRDYVPLDIGFSLNAHSGERFCTVGYPIVEIMAAIGLTHARPKRVSKLEYLYTAIAAPGGKELLDPVFLRAALGCCDLPFNRRFFRMRLDWPGQENQARCITAVEEIIYAEEK
jgi:CRISPR-associated protein Csx14